ncbi:type IV pilus modification protein PilV [Pseudomonas sp. CGJS7]|uniref:type IV pilus modification protein PilV n=1 Tax=Pseudomonas sp. CGJS7 TaxID=3109348 RepID=UPI0030099B75
MSRSSPLRRAPVSLARMRGLSLIEVLMSVLVLGIGLLGLALLQTTNLRLAQSSNNRTIATNLSSELMDDIRSNRLLVNKYVGTFKAADVSATSCTKTGTLKPEDQTAEFACKLKMALGPTAVGVVTVVTAPNKGPAVTIKIDWDDSRWKVTDKTTSFTMESTL